MGRPGRSLAYSLAISLLVFGAYAPTIPLGFFSDDFWLLLFAEYSPFDLHWFRLEPVSWTPFYRPIALTIWKVLFDVFGVFAPGFRVTALTIHVVNALLVALIARRRVPDHAFIALAAGAIFALLPIAVEALVWSSALYETTATCLFLIALLCVTRSCLGGGAPWYVASLAAFQLSLWSKESAVVFPAALALTMWRLPGRPRWTRVALLAAPYLLLVGVNFLYRYLVWHGLGATLPHVTPRDAFSLARRPIRGLVFLLMPMQDTLYSRSLYWPALAVMLLLVAAGLRSGRHRAVIGFGLAWFLVTIAPTVPFLDPVALNQFSQNSRYLYLPGVGFSIALAALVAGAFARVRQPWAVGAMSVIGAGFLILIQVQVGVWRVANDAVTSIPARIHQLLPDPRPFTCLQVANPPRHYNGAFVYWLGLDAAMLRRYDAILDVFCGSPYTAVPINSPNVLDDIFEVQMAFVPEARGWKVASARGLSRPNRETPSAAYWDARIDQHFASRMRAGDALRLAIAAGRPSAPPVIARWDFAQCSDSSRWTTADPIACEPTRGLVLDGSTGPRSLTSGPLTLLSHGWTEIILATDVMRAPRDGGRIALLWQGRPGGPWMGEGVLPIELPPKTGSYDLHFFVPPSAAPRDISGLRLEIQAGSAALNLATVRVRELR